jgi:hypothetical protein
MVVGVLMSLNGKEYTMIGPSGWMMVALFLAFTSVGSVYAADQSKARDDRGEIPQTGDQLTSKSDADVLRGKLVKVDAGTYTLETSPGRQVNIRTGGTTKFEENYHGMEGDWIEALVSPDMHVESIKKAEPAYIGEGDLLRVDGDFFVVKDESGKEIRLQTGKDSKLTGSHKVGDRIRAEYTPDGKVLSVKPAKIMRGPGGG